MKKLAEYINVRLHIISPLHIGCDDVYEPTNFVIDEQAKKLIEFEPVHFIKALSPEDRKRFSELCMSNNSLLQIFKFIRQKYNKVMGGREIDVSYGLISHYKKVLSLSSFDKKAVINNFLIQRSAYNPQSNQPYIPGSSIKGALRTGYLSILASCGGDLNELGKVLDNSDYIPANPIKGQRKARDLEERLLHGSFSTDPFSHVKVSDFLPLENVKPKVGYAVNRKKKESDKETVAENGPPQIFETINSGAVFEGQIVIRQPLGAGISHAVTKNNLLLAVHKHFARNLIEENKAIDANKLKREVASKVNGLFKDKLKKQAYLFRLGRHSGAEAVTIEGNRSIKIMQGKGRQPLYLEHATTFWLASDEAHLKNNQGLIPFGWAVLEPINE